MWISRGTRRRYLRARSGSGYSRCTGRVYWAVRLLILFSETRSENVEHILRCCSTWDSGYCRCSLFLPFLRPRSCPATSHTLASRSTTRNCLRNCQQSLHLNTSPCISYSQLSTSPHFFTRAPSHTAELPDYTPDLASRKLHRLLLHAGRSEPEPLSRLFNARILRCRLRYRFVTFGHHATVAYTTSASKATELSFSSDAVDTARPRGTAASRLRLDDARSKSRTPYKREPARRAIRRGSHGLAERLRHRQLFCQWQWCGFPDQCLWIARGRRALL